MSLGKRLFIGEAAAAAPSGGTSDTLDVFGDGNCLALYTLDYDGSETGGNYDGTPSNVDFGVDGQINWGASFNGSNSYIELSTENTGLTLFDRTNYSISLWYYTSNITTSGRIFSQEDGGGSVIAIRGDDFIIDTRDVSGSGASVVTPFSSSNNAWNHVVLTYDGTTYKLYLNGNQTPAATYAHSLYPTHATVGSDYRMALGARRASGSTSSVFNGVIDQVRIFDRAISPTEVSTLYGETATTYTPTTDTVDYQGTNAAYYKLDNNALDETTNNYDGAETDITYEFGRYGQAAVFNGSSSYITADKSVFGTGDGTADVFTISLWFNTTTNNGVLAGTRGNSATQGFILWLLSDGTIRYDEANATGSVDTLITTNTYDDGNWHNVVVTRNASNQATLYVDGSVQVSTTTITTALTSHTNNLFIGMYSAGSLHYNGSIDQVRIFDSALDATAVENLYNEKPEINTSNFETVLWNGNGGSQYVSSVGFESDFVWIKKRGNDTKDHRLFDTVRGANKVIYSSRDLVQGTVTNELTSFEANGFMLGNASAVNDADTNDSYVAWCWKAGGDAVLNQDGNINSQVSANQDAGFSIVKYVGNATDNTTVGTGLTTPADLVIAKDLDNAQYWIVGGSAVGNSKVLYLNDTTQALTRDRIKSVQSNTFTIGSHFEINGLNANVIAYCFHSVAGYQKIGSYTGGGLTKRVYTTNDGTSSGTGGFKPKFVMIKVTDTLPSGAGAYGSWVMHDNLRAIESTDRVTNPLYANRNYQEGLRGDGSAGAGVLDFTFESDGFTIEHNGYEANNSGKNYIYLAIA